MNRELFCNIGKDSYLKQNIERLVSFEVDEKIILLKLTHEIVLHISESLHSVEDAMDDIVGSVEDYQISFPWFYHYLTILFKFADELIDFQLFRISPLIINQ